MKDLIEKLEKATGPDRDLDRDIDWLVNAKACFAYRDVCYGWPTYRAARPYTASLDAALTLVPDND